MRLVLRNNDGESVSLQIKPDETFSELKQRIEDEHGIVLDLKDISLQGKRIIDSQKVLDYFFSQDFLDETSNALPEHKCIVPGCFNSKTLNPEKSFFHFPQEEIRCHQWVLYCQRLSMMTGKHKLDLNMDSTICSDHFRTDQFVKNTTTLLKRTAVPCKCPELPVADSTQLKRANAIIQNYSSLQQTKKELTNFKMSNGLNEAAGKIFDDHITLDSSNVDLDMKEGNEETTNPSHVVIDEMDLHSPSDVGDTLCRLCARPSNNCIFIFDEDGLQLGIAEKISACLPIAVKISDPLPKQVCQDCCQQLERSYALAEACINAENKLKTLKKENHFRLSLSSDNNSTPDSEELSNSSPLNDSFDQPHLDCPLCLDGTMQKTDSETSTDDSQRSKSEEESGSFKPDHESISFNHIVEELIDDQNEEKDSENLMANLEEIMEVGLPEESVESDETEWISTITSRSMDEIYLYSCHLCCADFRTFQAVMQHSLMHSDDGLYHCTLCDSSFTSQDDLEDHFMSKHNPENKHDRNISCNFCSTPLRTPELLNYHKCLSVNLASNKCKVCCKSFRSEGRLLFHMKFHAGAKPGYCDVCQKTFPDEVKLYKHVMYLHTTDKTHCCEECGKVFKSVSSLRYHQRSHQGEDVMKPYSCDQCGKCFIRKSMLRNHVTTSHAQISEESSCFTCKHCNEAFPTTTSAVAHMDAQHKTECNDDNTYSFEMHTVNRLYICEYCERCFTESTSLNAHRDRHLTDNPYQCKFCSEVFSSFGEHNLHKLKHEGQEVCSEYAGTFDIPTAYLCEYCDRNFLNYIKFSEHLTVHYGTAPYHCRFCNLKFSNSNDLIEHRATHQTATNEEFNYYRPYECHYCNKTFAIEDALVKHIRMHTGEKPFICDQCGKGFSQSSGLYTHQKVHSNERPYACPLCPRKFKIKGDRDVHVRKHSGDRPYKCEFCGKAFMTQHVYSQHRKIHTGERPYKCDVCGISFRRSHVLTVHKRIHTGEKPNVCDICGKRYRQKGDMLKHRRVQHGHVKIKLQKIEY